MATDCWPNLMVFRPTDVPLATCLLGRHAPVRISTGKFNESSRKEEKKKEKKSSLLQIIIDLDDTKSVCFG